jgi:hypothetical protein
MINCCDVEISPALKTNGSAKSTVAIKVNIAFVMVFK